MTETDIENQADKPGVTEAKKPLDPVAVELVKARKAAGMTQTELHLKTGISRDTIKGYESGRSMPGTRELRTLCETLGISANRALWGREDFRETVGPVKGRLMDPDASRMAKAKKLMLMLSMMSNEEVDAIFTLIEPIIVHRHGKKDVDKAFMVLDLIERELGADTRRVTNDVISGIVTDERLAEVTAQVEATARRRGPRK